MNKSSESFDLARRDYISGFEDKNEDKNTLIFPTLDLIAKEFNLSF